MATKREKINNMDTVQALSIIKKFIPEYSKKIGHNTPGSEIRAKARQLIRTGQATIILLLVMSIAYAQAPKSVMPKNTYPEIAQVTIDCLNKKDTTKLISQNVSIINPSGGAIVITSAIVENTKALQVIMKDYHPINVNVTKTRGY